MSPLEHHQRLEGRRTRRQLHRQEHFDNVFQHHVDGARLIVETADTLCFFVATVQEGKPSAFKTISRLKFQHREKRRPHHPEHMLPSSTPQVRHVLFKQQNVPIPESRTPSSSSPGRSLMNSTRDEHAQDDCWDQGVLGHLLNALRGPLSRLSSRSSTNACSR